MGMYAGISTNMKTIIHDVVEPQLWFGYIVKQSLNDLAFLQSGIFQYNERLQTLISGSQGGNMITVPYWKTLKGDIQYLSDEYPLIPNKIQATAYNGTVLARGMSWSYNNLATHFSAAGASPRDVIIGGAAQVWREHIMDTTLSVLDGVFNGIFSGLVYDPNPPGTLPANWQTIEPRHLIAARQKMGKNATKFTTIACHSAVLSTMQVKQKVDTIPNSMINFNIRQWLDYTWVIDDLLIPKNFGTASNPDWRYPVYMFERGALALATGALSETTSFAIDLDAAADDEAIFYRGGLSIQPSGSSINPVMLQRQNYLIKDPADPNYGKHRAALTNEQLADPNTWLQAFEDRREIGIIKLWVKVDPEWEGDISFAMPEVGLRPPRFTVPPEIPATGYPRPSDPPDFAGMGLTPPGP